MAYVDLNPIRANMADTPEESAHTSIKERLNPCLDIQQAIKEQTESGALRHFNQPLKPLVKFEGNTTNNIQRGVLFSLTDYLELIDFTGRSIHPQKRGAIPMHIPPILERLCLDRNSWIENATKFEQNYRSRFLCPKQVQADTG